MRTAAVFAALPLLVPLATSPLSSFLTSLFATLVGRWLTIDLDPEILFRCGGGGDGGSHLLLVMPSEFD